jgi:hypothetical protein
VVFDGYRCITFPLFATNSQVVTQQIRGDSGCHRSNGIFIAHGPAFRQGATVTGSQIVDLAPTILYLLGLPIPGNMDGKVLTEALQHGLLDKRPVQFSQPDDDRHDKEQSLPEEAAAEIESRLRALGYLG